MNESWKLFCPVDPERDRDCFRRKGRRGMDYLEIEKVTGRQIIDSRGNPTVEAEVHLADGWIIFMSTILFRMFVRFTI